MNIFLLEGALPLSISHFSELKKSRCMFFRLTLSLVMALLLNAAAPVLAATAAEQRDPQFRIAVLPFANYSDRENAEQLVMPALRKGLEQQGFIIAEDKAVDDFLLQERIRTTAYISTPLAQKLGEQLKLDAVLLGSVFVYDDGENPKFGFSARLLSARRSDLIWTGYASETGEDFTKILGLGTITSMAALVDTVVGRLFAGMSTAEGLGRETETAYRIAVMPFLNKTRKPDAGMIVTNLFLARLFQSSKFLPIEHGDVRNTVVTKKIRSKGELSHGGIDAFAEAIHADAVLVGVVEQFDDGSATGAPPAVIITARLIDSRTRRILWYGDMQLNGDERIRFFDIGKLRTVDKVAFSAVGDMIKRMERIEWK